MHHDSPRNVSSNKQEFHSNQVWARWDYSPEEWALFDRVDWQAARLRYWLPNLIVLVCFFCLLFLSVFVFHFAVLGPVLLIVFVLPVAVAPFLVRSYFLLEAKKRHNARQNRDQPQRVTFSQTGVWEAGTHVPFLHLRGVHMTSQPAVLHFQRRHHPADDTDNTFYQYDTLRVLVPRGHEEEATRLMERFRARITEVNNWISSSPPEPV